MTPKWEMHVSYHYHFALWRNIYLINPDGGIRYNVMINASFLPNAVFIEMIDNLEPNQVIFKERK
jgi:hypothetical protein